MKSENRKTVSFKDVMLILSVLGPMYKHAFLAARYLGLTAAETADLKWSDMKNGYAIVGHGFRPLPVGLFSPLQRGLDNTGPVWNFENNKSSEIERSALNAGLIAGIDFKFGYLKNAYRSYLDDVGIGVKIHSIIFNSKDKPDSGAGVISEYSPLYYELKKIGQLISFTPGYLRHRKLCDQCIDCLSFKSPGT